MPDLAPVSDDEASSLFDSFDTLEGPARERAAATLIQYRDQRVAADRSAGDSFWEGVYTDEAKRDQFWSHPALEDAAKGSLAPNVVRFRATNQGYLAHLNGLPVTQLDSTYEAVRDGYAKAHFGKDEMTDEAFYNAVSGQQKQIVETRKAVEEVPADIIASRFEDMESGQIRSIPEILTEWRNRYPDLKPNEGEETQMLAMATGLAQETDAFMSQYGEQTKAVFDVLSSQTSTVDPLNQPNESAKKLESIASGQAAKSEKDLVETLAQVPPEDRQKIYAYATLYAQKLAGKDGDWRTYIDNLQKSFLRSVEAPLRGVSNVDAEKNAQAKIDSGNEEQVKQGQKELQAIQIDRELNEVKENGIDSIQILSSGGWKYAEEGSYALAGSAPYLALAAIPVAGAPLTMGAYSATEYDRIRLAYPDVSIEQAAAMSLVSGGAQAALDKLQVATIAGRLPATGKLLEAIAKPTTPIAGRILAASGLNFAEQYGQETLQNITPLVVDEMAKSLGADIPDRDWSKELEQFKDVQAQTFFALLPLWLGASGGIALSESAKGQQFTANSEALQKIGIAPDAAEDIASEPDAAKRDTKLQAAWANVSDESKQKVIAEAEQAVSAANAIQSSPSAPTVESVSEEDGSTTFIVRNSQGKEISRTQDEDAAAAAVASANETENGNQTQVVSSLIQYFNEINSKRGVNAKFEFGEEPKTGQEFIDSLPEEDRPEAIEQLRERLRIEAKINPALDPEGDLASFVIDGQSEEQFKDGVYRYVNQITRGADPLVVVQEHMETEIKRALRENRTSLSWLRQQVQDYEAATGDSLLTDSDQSVVEAVSTLAQSYVTGKLKNPQIPTGLRAYFRQMVEYFRHVFVRAAKLRKAFRDEKVGKDFEQFLAQTVGLDDDAQIAKVTEQELQRSFSIKPADYTAKLDAALQKLESDPELRRERVEKGRTKIKQIRERLKKDETRREGTIRALGELEAIIRILPSEARGKIGGYRKLSEYKTDRGRINYLQNRIDKVEGAFEDWLKDYYTEKRDKLFKRAKPSKGKAGEKPQGKGADLQSLFSTLKDAVDWTPERAESYAAGLQTEIDKGELSAEEEAHKELEIALVPMFADWQNADAARRAAAVENAQKVFDSQYAKWKIAKAEQRERRQREREKLIKDTGQEGTAIERTNKALADNGLKGGWKDSLLGLLNFEQTVQWIFGESEIGASLVDAERKAAFEKSDSVQAKMDGLHDAFSKLAGSNLKGEQLRYDLSQKTLEIDGLKLSPLEGIAATMMWRQEDGKRHMIGHLDDNGKPSGKWHYNQSFVDKIETQLSDDAKAVRDYLTKEYGAEYATLNPIYRELNGIDLPKNENYSPITVTPLQAQGGQVIDPVTGTAMAAGSTTPGSLRTRGSSVSEPNFRDAVETYIAHVRQIEHWKSYAKFANEARALLNNRDVGNSVEAKSGKQGVSVLRKWVDFFAQGGTRDAATSLALNQTLNRIANRASAVALIGRVGTLAVQSTQLGAALANMPTGAYAKRLAKLLTGQLGWKAALNSPYIQRRLAEMPPVVQQATQGLRQTRPNLLRHAVTKLGNLISGTDALFTAGTYAITYDYELGQANALGLSGQEAADYARNAAERATDRVAQPIRPGTRSLFENTATQPLARAAWAFASEARKNLALSAYALAKRPASEKARVLAYVVLFNAALAAIIRNAWRDLRDSDDDEAFDEKNWNLKKFAVSTLTEPFYGIPVLGSMAQDTAYRMAGIYQPEGDIFSSFKDAAGPVKRVAKLATGENDYDSTEQALKDMEKILSAAGLFNQDLAAMASLSHLATDAFRTTQNVTNSP